MEDRDYIFDDERGRVALFVGLGKSTRTAS